VVTVLSISIGKNAAKAPCAVRAFAGSPIDRKDTVAFHPILQTTITFSGKAVDFGIPLLTNIQLANRLAEALSRKSIEELQTKELQAY
jgi:hypothetical protein